MENTTGKMDSVDSRATNMQITTNLPYPSNVAMCYPPQPSLSSPLADGNHASQAPGNYLVPPSMASPSSCLTTQQMYSNYPSPYYRSMLAGSQQSSMSSYYGTILPPPSHHSSAFYGTFYNPNSPSVYPSGQPPINPINYYSPSLYIQNHETMWPNSNSNSQPPAPAKRSYSYETSNISQLPACSKVSSSIMPTNTLPESRTTIPEETSTLITLEPLPECSSSAVEASKETDFMCVELDRPPSKCETVESPGDDESSVIDKESLDESEDEFDQEEDSSSSYTSSYTESFDGQSYTSEDLIPIENEDILDDVPDNILNDTSFGDIDRAKDLVDDDLQCLLCNNFDHLIPRLDIAIKLEPVVGESISKSSVLLCTQCDLMLERYLSLEKEVQSLQTQIQSMYQNNKHSDKQAEAEYCTLQGGTLPTEETNQDGRLNGTYATSQLGNPLPTTGAVQPSTSEKFESAAQLEVMDPTVIENEEPDQINKALEHTVDKEVMKPHKCQECGKFYSDVRSLQRHMKTHRVEQSNEIHANGQQTSNAEAVPFQCQQCPRQFQRRSHYHYHVKIHHGPREFKCQNCEKAFVSRGALTTHERIHSGEKPYECETCGRRFNVNSNLLAHVPKCTGTLPFKCEHCEKAFATRSLHQVHVKAHQGEFAVKCDECGMGFSKRSHLIAHQRTHTKEKPYQCPVCGKAFSSIGNCNSHTKTHADERKFVCEMCGKKFARRQALEMHLNRHTGVKPFKCGDCNRSFHDASNLINHKKTHRQNS